MARKKSVSGRSRGVTAVNRLFLEAERVNKILRALEKAGMYGVYASKRLEADVSDTYGISIHRSKSGRHTIKVSKKLTTQQYRAVDVALKKFLSSKVATPTQITRVRKKTREKIKQTLSEQVGREASDEDVDKFFEINEYAKQARQDTIFNYINPSDFRRLASEGKERGLTGDNFFKELIVPYIPEDVVNNKYIRDECIYLYNKYF